MQLRYQERPALGSTVQLGLVCDDDVSLDIHFDKLWLELFLFEQRCSRFLPDSELSQFNRAAGVRTTVTAEFRDALLAAQRMAQQTDGLFNPFVLPSLQRNGYKHSLVPGRADDAVDDHSSKRLVSADKLEIGDDWASIPYGTAIDLGGCGKGYIGDILAAMVDAWPEVKGYWLSIGGDVIVNGHDEHGKPWTVYLQPDPKQKQRLGEVAVPAGKKLAVATSTTLLRKGTDKGKKWHHIINPATGLPADSDVTVMVVCGDSLLEADVLASCGIIVGSAALSKFVEQHDVPAVAWLTDGRARFEVSGTAVTAYETWTAYT